MDDLRSATCFLVSALLTVALAVLATAADAQPRLHRGGIDRVPGDSAQPGRFALDLSAGVTTLEDFDQAEAFVTLTPRWRLMAHATGALDLTLPLLWIPGSHGAPDLDAFEVPLQHPALLAVFDVNANGVLDELYDLRPTGTEIGSSLVLAPSLEWTFCTATCWQPSVFVGAGVRQDRDRSARFGGGGRLGLDDVESPVLTFGVAVHKRLHCKLAVRLEARALTTFYDDETFFLTEIPGGTGGVPVGLEGDAVTSLWLSAGIRFGR